jgi:ethylmalonyl-CoA mutase
MLVGSIWVRGCNKAPVSFIDNGRRNRLPLEERKVTSPKTNRPWIMRTYSGHSSPSASNELYRANLAKGQTGLSVAFDLPTQTGYDPDHPLARGEVGRVGVPVSNLDDMRVLFDQIPIERMNTSMTINATAPWLLALYVALAEERGVDPSKLQGTTQNDIVKEYLSRGTYVFPPAPSLRLTGDVIAYTIRSIPSWNPMNVCSYHLQEAGATPVQEIAYALSASIAVLDEIKGRDEVDEATFSQVFGRISFFVNAGMRFVREMAKLRAFAELWERLGRERYGIDDDKMLRFRYGVQVNSLGLTENQAENNIIRIVIEMLGVTLSKRARARAVQLPAWNEALGLPRSWDQQWSLRAQQIMAFETDLLEHGDLFDGSPVVESLVHQLRDEAWAEVQRVLEQGGVVACVESGYIKERLVASHAARLAAIERGEQKVVGVNVYVEGEPSPLMKDGGAGAILAVDPDAEKNQVERVRAWRAGRNSERVTQAIDALKQVARRGDNIMPPSIAAAHAGVTTGEWADALREVFGEYRAPTGVASAAGSAPDAERIKQLRVSVDELQETLGRRVKLLLGKPGLDGHSNGVEQIALRARDVGLEVVYEGIRVTPAQIARAAVDEGVHVVGLSILSGAHMDLVPEVVRRIREQGLEIPVVVGGIIPSKDAALLREAGVARVYTPKDFELDGIMRDIIELVRTSAG